MRKFIYTVIWLAILVCVPLSFFTASQKKFPYIVLEIPDRYNPWAELNLKDELSPLTRYKLSKFKHDIAACTAALERAEIHFTPIPDQTVSSCPLSSRINLEQTQYPYSAPVRPTCAVAATLIIWEEQIVQKAARKHLNDTVSRIDHMGIFSCRNIAGSNRRSQHASANAIDIGGFRLDSGGRVSVLKDWGKDTPKGKFLHDIRNGSCDIFRGVLGPEYNAAHANHFHLDFGPYTICR